MLITCKVMLCPALLLLSVYDAGVFTITSCMHIIDRKTTNYPRAQASEQGNVIRSVRIYIYIYIYSVCVYKKKL